MHIRVKDADAEEFGMYGSLVALPDYPAPLGTDAIRFWPALAKYSTSSEMEMGMCTCLERPRQIERLERHLTTPEILVPLDCDFLLPLAPADQPENGSGKLEAGGVEIIRFRAGTAVVLNPGVRHWAVWPANGESVTYLVEFRSDTHKEDLETKDTEDIIQF